MTRTASIASRTYLPDSGSEAQIIDFVKALERSGAQAPSSAPAIVDAQGQRTEIPPAMVDVLRQVAESLRRGQGVTVAPLNAMMTTQEAADFLGISRPTLVRILERGEIAMERPGRHRYVRLSDVLSYQQRVREMRTATLDAMASDAERDGLYEATDAVPPPMR
mgnify:FL=1